MTKLLTFILAMVLAGSVNAAWYISPDGNDSNDGKSLTNSLLTSPVLRDSIDNETDGPDTVYIMAGTYENFHVFFPVGGTAAASTIIVSIDTLNGGEEYWSAGAARIFAGDTISSWAVHAGSVYRAAWTQSDYDFSLGGGASVDKECHTLTQDDSLLYWVTSLGAVDASGEFWYDTTNNYIYAYFWDLGSGIDGDSYSTWAGAKPAFISNLDANTQNHVLIWGMYLGVADETGIWLGFNYQCDSCEIISCDLNNVSHAAAQNPGLIGSRGASNAADPGEMLLVDSCTFGNCMDQNFTPQHSSAMVLYGNRKVEVCHSNFVGKIGTGINLKESHDFADTEFKIHHNSFSGGTVADGAAIFLGQPRGKDSVWANTMNGYSYGIWIGYWYCESDGFPTSSVDCGDVWCGFNTIYNSKFGYGLGDATRSFECRGSQGTKFTHNVIHTVSTNFEIWVDTNWIASYSPVSDSNWYYNRTGGTNDVRCDSLYGGSGIWYMSLANACSGYDLTCYPQTGDPELNTTTYVTTGVSNIQSPISIRGESFAKAGAIQDEDETFNTTVIEGSTETSGSTETE